MIGETISLQVETPCAIVQDDWEFTCLRDLYLTRTPRRVLEVGTYRGGTLYWWLSASWPKHVVSVDLREHEGNAHLYDEWASSGTTWAEIVGDSNDEAVAARVADHAPFDWIFIDAGHRDHEIRADVRLYLPLVAPGGCVAFHDVREVEEDLPQIQVARVWRELREEHRSVEWTTPGAGGIGVLFP